MSDSTAALPGAPITTAQAGPVSAAMVKLQATVTAAQASVEAAAADVRQQVAAYQADLQQAGMTPTPSVAGKAVEGIEAVSTMVLGEATATVGVFRRFTATDWAIALVGLAAAVAGIAEAVHLVH